VLNHETIRNASFSLVPIGYNPEEVDSIFNALAEKVAGGEPVTELLATASFEATGVGYAPDEVDEFLAMLDADNSDDAVETMADSDLAADVVDSEDEELPRSDTPIDVPEDTHVDGSDGESVADAFGDEGIKADGPGEQHIERDEKDENEIDYVLAPPAVEWRDPSVGSLDLDVLGQAVHRTADTLGSLQGFIENEITAMKLAVERQAQDTAKRCETLLAQASAEAHALTESVNVEISRARKAADSEIEKDRRELAKEIKQAHADSETETTKMRADAEKYATDVRAEADNDRAEAQRTIENAISMQSSIAESLERAREQLTPSATATDDLAA
jgi:cell division septum initiation protein DivIVA